MIRNVHYKFLQISIVFSDLFNKNWTSKIGQKVNPISKNNPRSQQWLLVTENSKGQNSLKIKFENKGKENVLFNNSPTKCALHKFTTFTFQLMLVNK